MSSWCSQQRARELGDVAGHAAVAVRGALGRLDVEEDAACGHDAAECDRLPSARSSSAARQSARTLGDRRAARPPRRRAPRSAPEDRADLGFGVEAIGEQPLEVRHGGVGGAPRGRRTSPTRLSIFSWALGRTRRLSPFEHAVPPSRVPPVAPERTRAMPFRPDERRRRTALRPATIRVPAARDGFITENWSCCSRQSYTVPSSARLDRERHEVRAVEQRDASNSKHASHVAVGRRRRRRRGSSCSCRRSWLPSSS